MSKSDRDRAKAMQEKFQAILSNFLKDEDNKYCVDCDAKGPRWASWNLGVFLCIRCAGIHRKMGVHISKVKSVNLDTWLPEQLAMLQEMGNSRARAVYEANLPDNFRRPQTDSALEAFIRAKYEMKKYIAKEWIPPQPRIPKEWIEDDRDKKKSRPKTGGGQIHLNATPPVSKSAPATSSPALETKASSGSTPHPTAPAPKPVAAAPTVTPASASADLMGLESTAQATVPNGGENLLADIFGGPPAPSVANGQSGSAGLPGAQNGSDSSLLEEVGKGSEKSAKDSIMALFGSGQQQQPQMFGVPAEAPSGGGGEELMYFQQPQTAAAWPRAAAYGFPNYSFPSFPFVPTSPGGMYMPQQNVGMYGNMQIAAQPGIPQQGIPQQGIPQQGIPQQGIPQQGIPQQGIPQQGIPQQGIPQQGMAQAGMPQQGIAGQGMQRMPYSNMMGVQQPNPTGMYGMGQMAPGMGAMPAGNMMMQGNMMYGQQPQPAQQMQYQQMQQQMAAMKLAGTGGAPAGGGGWGGLPGSGQTLSTNLWQ